MWKRQYLSAAYSLKQRRKVFIRTTFDYIRRLSYLNTNASYFARESRTQLSLEKLSLRFNFSGLIADG